MRAKATQQATLKAIGSATVTKHQQPTITFGTLTFVLNEEGISEQAGNLNQVNNSNHLHGKSSQRAGYNLPSLLPTRNCPTIHKQQTTRPIEHKHTSLTAQQPNAAPRFIKQPPATEEWQQVLRKTKKSTATNKYCFSCHKKGHLQRFCWRKIECYRCGRFGHKRAKCLFKPRDNYTTASKQTTKKPLTTAKLVHSNMEFIHGRPPLSDIYNPPQQALNVDNEYLCNVGLIVLIRGPLSPDLPQLIAMRMVEIRGGTALEYAVTQATITPYIITCPTIRIRDIIVQGGIYTIPQTGVQFKVHEWRPRFGMGYDPPTHQIWVKLVGLPLQAWTMPEVYSFIQNFGYPLQVQPFGQAAGHYRDITALVAAKHPTRIPLAHMYKEGDYST